MDSKGGIQIIERGVFKPNHIMSTDMNIVLA